MHCKGRIYCVRLQHTYRWFMQKQCSGKQLNMIIENSIEDNILN